jgi:hypothetical protein
MLSFYLDKEAFNKEVMSWSGVKHNLCKSGMHYILPRDILKKKYKEVGAGLSSGLEPQKPESLELSDSKEEDEMHPLEWKKIMLLTLHPLPANDMFLGEDVNSILSVILVTESMMKKPRT